MAADRPLSLPREYLDEAVTAARERGRDFAAQPLTGEEQEALLAHYRTGYTPRMAGQRLAGELATVRHPLLGEGDDDEEAIGLGGAA